MKIVAIDTVTDRCSAALMIGGEYRVRSEISRNRHSSLILPMIGQLLAEAGIVIGDVDAIAFDRGPGSFTGVRIGAGVAQGLAFAADLPVVGVSSLQALAAACGRDRVLAAIDARMGQVYWALIRNDSNAADSLEERLDDPSRVRVDCSDVHGVGSGWDAYGDILEGAAISPVNWTAGCHPGAEWVARLAGELLRNGSGAAPETALPVYLRNHVAG